MKDQWLLLGSGRTQDLIRLRAFIQKCHVDGKVKDSLALDRDKVTATASSLCSRWQDIRLKLDSRSNTRQLF